MAENAITKPCAVSFWNFAIPVAIASLGSSAVSYVVKKRFDGEHSSIQEAALLATKFGAFWLFGGFAWIAMCKRNGVTK